VRVDPAGGGTDAPPFSVEHGGMVVNFAVKRHAWATAERLPPGSGIVVWAADLRRGFVADSVDAMPADQQPEFLAAFVRRFVPEGDSVLLVTESDVPPGSGLGGSGAIGVAIVGALDRLYGRSRSQAEIAEVANAVERADLGYPGGNQDSYGAALGGINRLEYVRGGGTVPHRVETSSDTLRTLEHSSLLIYTGAAHVSGSIHEDIKNSYALPDSPTVRAMLDLRAAAEQMSAALESGDLDGYVRALDASCDHLYALHPSCDSDDHRRYRTALEALILGRKTCGAGGGGFLLVHARPGCRRECIRRAEELGATVWPVSIDFDGVVSWTEAASSEAYVASVRRAIV